MGIFDKLLRAIGFEDEDATLPKSENRVEQKKKNIKVNSKFDLKNLEEKEEVIDEAPSTYFPRTQDEIEEIAIILATGKSAVVDFGQFSESDRMRAVDFLSGAIFVLNGNIEKINKTSYLLKNKGK